MLDECGCMDGSGRAWTGDDGLVMDVPRLPGPNTPFLGSLGPNTPFLGSLVHDPSWTSLVHDPSWTSLGAPSRGPQPAVHTRPCTPNSERQTVLGLRRCERGTVLARSRSKSAVADT